MKMNLNMATERARAVYVTFLRQVQIIQMNRGLGAGNAIAMLLTPKELNARTHSAPMGFTLVRCAV